MRLAFSAAFLMAGCADADAFGEPMSVCVEAASRGADVEDPLGPISVTGDIVELADFEPSAGTACESVLPHQVILDRGELGPVRFLWGKGDVDLSLPFVDERLRIDVITGFRRQFSLVFTDESGLLAAFNEDSEATRPTFADINVVRGSTLGARATGCGAETATEITVEADEPVSLRSGETGIFGDGDVDFRFHAFASWVTSSSNCSDVSDAFSWGLVRLTDP